LKIGRCIAAIGALVALTSCATAQTPSTSAGEYLSGRLAAGLNDIDAAARSYGAAVAANPDDIDIVRSAFLFYVAAGEIEASAPYARTLIAAGEDKGLASLTLALIDLKHGDLHAARDRAKGEFAEPLANSAAFIAGAWIEAEIAGPAAGVSAFDLGKDVFTGFNPTFKAMLLEERGDIETAGAAHQISVASFGGPIGRAAYGAFLERHGEEGAARDYYLQLKKEGGASRRLALAGLARLEKGRPSTEFTNVAARDGVAMALYLFAGNLIQQSAEEMQRASEAGFRITERPFNLPLALSELAVYLDPDLADARRLIGSIHNIYGNYDAARAAFAAVKPSSAQFEQAQIEIANSLAAEDKIDAAIATLKSAVRRDRDAEDARLTLAGYYTADNRHDEAVKEASRAIARLEEPPPVDAWRHYITRAASLLELDRFDDAERDLKKAVEIAPEEPVALNYLGYSWAERGINLDEAFSLIEKAVALRPQSGAIIDSLGWAHYQRGEFEEALPHLEKAAALEPADPTVTDHLGDVYWRLGRKTEARFQWERALELDPKDQARAMIEKKLESGLDPVAPQ